MTCANAARRFEGRHVLVTGAGTGIGRAIAVRLAAEGARLTLLARDRARLEETLRLAAASAATVSGHRAFAADVRDRQAIDRAIARAAQEGGPFHGAVANAGIGGPNGPPSKPADGGVVEVDRFDDLVATNLVGTYNVLRAVERHLVPVVDAADPASTRHLVAIASILARIGVAGYTGYCASKAGVTGLVRALAVELAPKGVQVNTICPGWVDTEMAWEGIDGLARATGVSREEALAIAMRDVPLGRMSAPADIAGAVAWLLSDDARGVTGQALDVNGGAFMV